MKHILSNFAQGGIGYMVMCVCVCTVHSIYTHCTYDTNHI